MGNYYSRAAMRRDRLTRPEKETDVRTKTAFVRMRGEEWDISLAAAEALEAEGRIWRDYDCDQNTIDNGYPDLGPAYGVTGDEDSIEERQTARLLDLLVAGGTIDAAGRLVNQSTKENR